MEMLHAVAEAVLISFVVGAIRGGMVTAHMQARYQNQNQDDKLEAVKVKVNRNDG